MKVMASMTAEEISQYERDLQSAAAAGEPEDWNMSVPKTHLREMLAALKRKSCECES